MRLRVVCAAVVAAALMFGQQYGGMVTEHVALGTEVLRSAPSWLNATFAGTTNWTLAGTHVHNTGITRTADGSGSLDLRTTSTTEAITFSANFTNDQPGYIGTAYLYTEVAQPSTAALRLYWIDITDGSAVFECGMYANLAALPLNTWTDYTTLADWPGDTANHDPNSCKYFIPPLDHIGHTFRLDIRARGLTTTGTTCQGVCIDDIGYRPFEHYAYPFPVYPNYRGLMWPDQGYIAEWRAIVHIPEGKIASNLSIQTEIVRKSDSSVVATVTKNPIENAGLTNFWPIYSVNTQTYDFSSLAARASPSDAPTGHFFLRMKLKEGAATLYTAPDFELIKEANTLARDEYVSWVDKNNALVRAKRKLFPQLAWFGAATSCMAPGTITNGNSADHYRAWGVGCSKPDQSLCDGFTSPAGCVCGVNCAICSCTVNFLPLPSWTRSGGIGGANVFSVMRDLGMTHIVHYTPFDAANFGHDTASFTQSGTITSSGAVVTGSGTSFTSLKPRQMILASSQWREIASIASNTSLTVRTGFSPDLTGSTFDIEKCGTWGLSGGGSGCNPGDCFTPFLEALRDYDLGMFHQMTHYFPGSAPGFTSDCVRDRVTDDDKADQMNWMLLTTRKQTAAITIIGATNANPVVFQCSAACGFDMSKSPRVRIENFTGGWSGLNNKAWYIALIDATHFSVAFDSSGAGSFSGQNPLFTQPWVDSVNFSGFYSGDEPNYPRRKDGYHAQFVKYKSLRDYYDQGGIQFYADGAVPRYVHRTLSLGDVVNTDPYPVINAGLADDIMVGLNSGNRRHGRTYVFARRMATGAFHARPVWITLQLWTQVAAIGFPQLADMKIQAVSALAAGATGFGWWQLGSLASGFSRQLPGDYANVKRIADMPTRYGDVLVTGPQDLTDRSDGKAQYGRVISTLDDGGTNRIKLATFVRGSRKLIAAINLSNIPTTATFTTTVNIPHKVLVDWDGSPITPSAANQFQYTFQGIHSAQAVDSVQLFVIDEPAGVRTVLNQ